MNRDIRGKGEQFDEVRPKGRKKKTEKGVLIFFLFALIVPFAIVKKKEKNKEKGKRKRKEGNVFLSLFFRLFEQLHRPSWA